MRTFLLVLGLACAAGAQDYHQWWNDRHPGRPFNSPDAKKLPQLSVRGNKIVDPQGNAVLVRGLAISDPDKIEHQGHWNKEHFVKVQEMGTRVVRIPVHPVAWRERTPEKYLALLDQAVQWCTELNMYVMIDWHSIGNLKSGLFQDPMYDTSMQETFSFWRAIARRYARTNTVAFYDLFNEPTLYRNQLGRMSWEEWKKINEDLIALIRAFDTKTIPMVSPLDWAYDLTPLHISPIEAAGIVYVTHPYAHKRTKPWEPKWDEDFGFAAATYPIIASEFGFNLKKGLTPAEGDYGPAIIKYLESKGIGWVAWCFDPQWGPNLISSWDPYELTGAGEFFKKAMKGSQESGARSQ